MKIVAASALLPVILVVDQVNAHGYISKPAATYRRSGSMEFYTGFNAEVTASVNAGFSGGVYNHSPEENTASFTAHWAATGYSSLKEMCDPIATDYGWADPNATPKDVSSETEFWWQNDEYDQGFLDSHHGPCELWIDNTRVWHYDDCRAKFPEYPAKIPTDYSVCKGNCLVSFYWLALHSSNWQIYKQCVPITNPNGKGSSTSSTSASTGTTNASSGQTGAEADDDLDDSEDGCSQRRMDRKMRRRALRALKNNN